jgi:hypothetical protein
VGAALDASLVGTLAPVARISPWHWFNPSPARAGGAFAYGDALVPAAVAAVCCGAATMRLLRRDV